MGILLGLRSLLHGSDAHRAVEAERTLLAHETARQSELDARLARAFTAPVGDAVELGVMVGTRQPVTLAATSLSGHVGIWGPSGSGKSYLLVTFLKSLLTSGIRRMVVCDPKAETVALLKRAILDVAATLPPHEADQLLDRVVCIDLFSKEVLPRLQLLAPEAGLDPELHAYTIARLITDESDMAVGVRQEAVLHRVIECLIRAGLPLTVLPQVLQEPLLLDALAERHAPADLFRATAERLRTESRDRLTGLVSRAERLLRLRSTRLALGGARDAIDFGRMLDEKIVLINLEPPEGSVDVGRFLAGLLWVKLTQAVRRRKNGSPPSILVLEEWPAFLAGGNAQTGDQTEELLRLARSKGVFLYLLAQDLISVGKICPTLPAVVRNNAHLHAIFRTTDDWSFALPVTGKRLKESAPPWEERRGATYLERGAELALLKEELARLPDRHLLLLDRRTGLPGVLMRTADLRLRATDTMVEALEARSARSDLVLPVADLEREAAAVQARLSALVAPKSAPGGPAAAASPEPPRRRRGARPLDMG